MKALGEHAFPLLQQPAAATRHPSPPWFPSAMEASNPRGRPDLPQSSTMASQQAQPPQTSVATSQQFQPPPRFTRHDLPQTATAAPQQTQAPPQLSFTKAVSGSLGWHDLVSIPVVDVPLSLRQPQMKDGKPTIVFSPLELAWSEVPLHHALIAKFSKSRPKMDILRQHINSKWGISAQPIIIFIDRRHILIKLQNVEDLAKAWTRDSHAIEGSLFRLFKWSRDFKASEESLIALKGMH